MLCLFQPPNISDPITLSWSVMCSLLREYIELEFSAHMASKQLSFALDVERVVDDIVLFCMLVGNDFLPGGAPGQHAAWHGDT